MHSAKVKAVWNVSTLQSFCAHLCSIRADSKIGMDCAYAITDIVSMHITEPFPGLGGMYMCLFGK